jgi:hypothetical protein
VTLPDLDARDYVGNNDYSEQPEEPEEMWVVYYQGLSGRWFITLPFLYEENAIKHANALERNVKILHYQLTSSAPHQRKTTKKVKKIAKPTKKVRKVRTVV